MTITIISVPYTFLSGRGIRRASPWSHLHPCPVALIFFVYLCCFQGSGLNYHSHHHNCNHKLRTANKCVRYPTCANGILPSQPADRYYGGDVDVDIISLASTFWEERIRQEATEILLPVFFPAETAATEVVSGGRDGVRVIQKDIISAELSLKRFLRKNYGHGTKRIYHDETGSEAIDSYGDMGRNLFRRRLADLVLGTSIMRLRHWYSVVNAINLGTQPQQQRQLFKCILPYPLDPNWFCSGDNVMIDNILYEEESLSSQDQNASHSAKERSLVRAMVDEHARLITFSSSIKSKTNERDALLLHLNSTSYDPAMQLSIRFSIPPYLAVSFLSQYGYEQTQDICTVMNRPGPVTLRKNAIKFTGTDDELCKYLKEVDGIHATTMRRSNEEGGGGGRSNLLMVTTSTRYDERSTRSYILPPRGALQVSMDTTTVEKSRQRRKSIWSSLAWRNGYFEVQDAGSQIIVQSLEVVPGMSILDYCAGNGGKTFGLASSIMADAASRPHSSLRHSSSSRIIAHDVVEERIRQIEGSMVRTGFAIKDCNNGTKDQNRTYIVERHLGDYNCTILIETITELPVDSDDNSALTFDAVLVDAPCSSTGVLRRRPAQRWDVTQEQIYDTLPKLQLKILENAASFVDGNGGRLVYSTCSLLREENECVANMFELSDAYRKGNFERWVFIPDITSDDTHQSGTSSTKIYPNTINLLPSSECDGFFIARWRRRSESLSSKLWST